MTIAPYQIQNVLRTYQKQLNIDQGEREEGTKNDSDIKDEVTLSEESKSKILSSDENERLVAELVQKNEALIPESLEKFTSIAE